MNKVDLVVLGFLMRTPMHGYQIAEFFEKRGIEFWVKIKMPSVYKALNRLEEKVHITGEVEIDTSNRARKVYSITDSGREYFQEMLDEIFFSEKFVNPFDFWNAFRFLDKNINREYFEKMINHRKLMMQDHWKKMHEKRKDCEGDIESTNIPFYVKMLMESLHKRGKEEFELLDEMMAASALPENANAFKNIDEENKI